MVDVHGWPGGRSLALIGLLLLAGMPARGEQNPVEARLRRDISFLASDACEGRGVTTRGINLAADYIAHEFKQAGLRPAGPGGSYFQPFTMRGATLETANHLWLRGPQGQRIELQMGRQFQPLGISHSGKVTAPVVFVGYGASSRRNMAYDDYKGVDVDGKIVIVLRDTPRAGNKYLPFAGLERPRFASFTSKLQNADKHKAAAVLFVNDRDTARAGDELLDFRYNSVAWSPVDLPALHVRRCVIDEMLQASLDTGLRDLEAQIDRELKPHSAALTGWTASLEVHVHRGTIAVKNVVGVVDGSGPLANETVVVGAHYDHLGYGFMGSLSGLKNPAIHHGADDNGSGTTALMELARRFGRQKQRAGRRLVFIAFSGEEMGLFGSEYYCKEPLFPLADTVAMVNMDMVGRLGPDRPSWQAFGALLTPWPELGLPVAPLSALAAAAGNHWLPPGDQLIVYGTGTARTFDSLIDRVNGKHHFHLHKPRGADITFASSDHANFYGKKIPVFFFFTGDHADYHCPSDTADKINIAGMRQITGLVEDVVDRLAQVPERPAYVKVASTSPRPEGNIPRLGIRPSYGDVEDGVLLGGVSEGGPASRAGMKEGDRIVEIAGKPVKDLQHYMVLLGAQKKGQPIDLGILRDGKKLKIRVTPE
ncbi:MAG TPA: M28 family peptidase [Gemmataceae bacterium]|nr:M28 family peptidase [Gemmataceae bacterium]